MTDIAADATLLNYLYMILAISSQISATLLFCWVVFETISLKEDNFYKIIGVECTIFFTMNVDIMDDFINCLYNSYQKQKFWILHESITEESKSCDDNIWHKPPLHHYSIFLRVSNQILWGKKGPLRQNYVSYFNSFILYLIKSKRGRIWNCEKSDEEAGKNFKKKQFYRTGNWWRCQYWE